MSRFWVKFRDCAMTWPNLTIKLELLPWHWRLLPRGWYDYSPGWEGPDERRAGWFGLSGRWLMFDVDFGLNLPPFLWEDA